VLQPVAVFVSDEGTNGLAVHLLNERPEAIEVTLSVVTYDEDDRPVFQAEQRRVIAARSNTSFAMADLADGFLDLSYAYRFGPQAHHLVVTTLRHAEGILAQDFCFPAGRPSHCASDLGLTAEATRLPDGRSAIRLETRRFAQAVHFESANFLPRDEYFHMAPNSTRLLLLDDAAGTAPAVLKGSVAAVNWRTTALIQSAT
jgi:beta-mannosidase